MRSPIRFENLCRDLLKGRYFIIILGEDVIFGGVILSEDSWLFADKNGWLVSKELLEVN